MLLSWSITSKNTVILSKYIITCFNEYLIILTILVTQTIKIQLFTNNINSFQSIGISHKYTDP